MKLLKRLLLTLAVVGLSFTFTSCEKPDDLPEPKVDITTKVITFQICCDGIIEINTNGEKIIREAGYETDSEYLSYELDEGEFIILNYSDEKGGSLVVYLDGSSVIDVITGFEYGNLNREPGLKYKFINDHNIEL